MVMVESGSRKENVPQKYIVEVVPYVSEYLASSIRVHLLALVDQEKDMDFFSNLADRLSNGEVFENWNRRVMVRLSLSEQDLMDIRRLRSDRVIPGSITEAGEIAAAMMSLQNALKLAKDNGRIHRSQKRFWRWGK